MHVCACVHVHASVCVYVCACMHRLVLIFGIMADTKIVVVVVIFYYISLR